MKICYLADARSGHTKRWIEYFARDNEIDLITFSYTTEEDTFIPETDYIKMGVRVHKISKKMPYILMGPIIVRRLIHQIQPDIVHAHYATQYGFCGALSGFHPFFLSVWGSDVLEDPDKSVVFKQMVKLALKKADMVHAGSKIFIELVSRLYSLDPEKMTWTYYGVQDNFLNLQSLSNGNISYGNNNETWVVSIRSFDSIYSVDTLIAAIPKVRDKYPDVRFMVIGEGSEESEIKNLAVELKVNDVIQFRKFVPHNELPEVLKNSDIYVDTLPISAGVSVGLLEAMASGCFPVVARIPGVSEVITDGKNGLIFEGKNSDQLAEKICFAIKNKELRKNAGKRNVEIILDRGLYDKNMDQINRLYVKLVSSTGSN